MSIQTKFDLYVSDLNKKIHNLVESEIKKDLEIFNNILDISNSYQDEIGSSFVFKFHYGTTLAPIKIINGYYEYDKDFNLDFGTSKELTINIDRGYINIHVDLNPKLTKWEAETQRQCDKFRNNILKFYPNMNVKIARFLMIISYNRSEI